MQGKGLSAITDLLPDLDCLWTLVLPVEKTWQNICYILPIPNVPIDLNNFFVNIQWTLTFCIKKNIWWNALHISWKIKFMQKLWFATRNTFTVQITNDNHEIFKVKLCAANALIKTFFPAISGVSLLFENTSYLQISVFKLLSIKFGKELSVNNLIPVSFEIDYVYEFIYK